MLYFVARPDEHPSPTLSFWRAFGRVGFRSAFLVLRESTSPIVACLRLWRTLQYPLLIASCLATTGGELFLFVVDCSLFRTVFPVRREWTHPNPSSRNSAGQAPGKYQLLSFVVDFRPAFPVLCEWTHPNPSQEGKFLFPHPVRFAGRG